MTILQNGRAGASGVVWPEDDDAPDRAGAGPPPPSLCLHLPAPFRPLSSPSACLMSLLPLAKDPAQPTTPADRTSLDALAESPPSAPTASPPQPETPCDSPLLGSPTSPSSPGDLDLSHPCSTASGSRLDVLGWSSGPLDAAGRPSVAPVEPLPLPSTGSAPASSALPSSPSADRPVDARALQWASFSDSLGRPMWIDGLGFTIRPSLASFSLLCCALEADSALQPSRASQAANTRVPSPPLFSPARCLRADAGEYGPPRRGTRGTEISSSRIADLALSLTLCFLPARPHFSSPRASSNASSFCVSKLQPASRVLRRPAVLDRPLASSPTTLSAPPSAGFRPRMQNYWAGGASSTAPGSPCAFCARQLTVSGTFQSTGTACVASRSSRSRTVRPLPARLRASSADSADRPYPTPIQHALLSPPRGLARRACTRARGIRSEPSLDCPSPDRAAVLAADPCAVRPLRRAFARRALKVDSRRGESAGEVEGKVCVAVMPPQSTSIYVLAETGGGYCSLAVRPSSNVALVTPSRC